MNKKQWTGLLMIYISYLLFGATIFYFIEVEAEEQDRIKKYNDFKELTAHIRDRFGVESEAKEFTEKLTDYCGKTFDFTKDINEVVPALWNFYNAFFFVVTVVSTIGYGNLHPTTDLGRVLMIFYAIIGIPLNGILLSSLGQFFGAVFHRAHRKYKSHGRYGARCTLTVNILTYLTPGLIIFIFLPAGLFCVFEEDWDYIDAVYFAFVTLTTIGFGDLVAGQQDTKDAGPGLMAYKVMLICWVIFGLGYLIMLLGFVAQAMQAKRIVRLEEKLMASLTHSKIWHGFAKDIGYLRRVMNELYLDKLKPVFRDEKVPPPQIIHRSKSLPDIFKHMEDEEILKQCRRERAMSEHVPKKIALTRVFSETDLQRIDRNATFAAASTVPTTIELMRRVIDVYTGGQMREWPSEEDADLLRGVEGFSDSEVLSSENWYDHQSTITAPVSRHPSSVFNVPSYEDTVSRQPHRGRAMSECPPPEVSEMTPSSNPAGPVDWTWSGPNANKLHDIIKQRNKQRMLLGMNNGRKPSLTASLVAGAKRMNPLKLRRRCITESNSNETNVNSNGNVTYPKLTLSVPENIGGKRRSLQENRRLPEVRRSSNYMTHTAGVNRGDLTTDLHKLYSRDDNLFNSDANRREILEETSLADFLRVLTNLHSRVGERLVAAESQPKPRRKMGTASLTPPRIRSLLELFPEPKVPDSMKQPRKRKPSKISNLFRTDSRRESVSMVPTGENATDKPPEPSNLKRLGRFLLRSYSIAPKDSDEPKPSRRKRFSLWPSESDERGTPPFQVQIDSPSSESKVSTDVTITIESEELRRPSIPTIELPGLLFPPNQACPPPQVIITPSVDLAPPRSPKQKKNTHWLLDDPPSNFKDE